MGASKIEWTEETWNPVVGCRRVSEGCRHCYAEGMAKRLAAMGVPKYQGLLDERGRWNGAWRLDEGALLAPLRRKKPTVYFVNSMGDLFLEGIPDDVIDVVFAVMAATPQHTYQVLTKRPARAAAYFESAVTSAAWADRLEDAAACYLWGELGTAVANWVNGFCLLQHAPEDGNPLDGSRPRWPLPNVWLGTSVENQAAADERVPALLGCPAAVRFLSCEPLLGAVDLGLPVFQALAMMQLACGGREVTANPTTVTYGERVDWVIVGGESGAGARPMHPDWARELRDQCVAAGVAFFFKQWGEWSPPNGQTHYDTTLGREAKPPAIIMSHDGADYCFSGEHIDRPAVLVRVGKKVAGRELDGRTWDELPAREHPLASLEGGTG